MYIDEIKTKENAESLKGIFWVKSRANPVYFPAGGGGWRLDFTVGDRTGEIRLAYFDN